MATRRTSVRPRDEHERTCARKWPHPMSFAASSTVTPSFLNLRPQRLTAYAARRLLLKSLSLVVLVCWANLSARASITINIFAGAVRTADGSAPMPPGGQVFLVASTTDGVFDGPTAGAFVTGDDVILQRWDFDSGLGDGLFLGALQFEPAGVPHLTAGDPLRLYWFPTLTAGSTSPGDGTPYGFCRGAAGIDGSDAWVVPAEGSTVDLTFATESAGGSHPDSAGAASSVVVGNLPPALTSQPQAQAHAAGTTVTFTVTATGSPPLNYQWRRNGANIAAATSATLTLSSVTAADSGVYSVRVWNDYGSVVSTWADLVVLADPANGNPPGLPLYSSLPPKQKDQDSLVLVTHGWNPDLPLWPDAPPSDVPWLNDFAGSVGDYLAAHGLRNWQVVPYKWLANSFTHLPDSAAVNGAKEGANVGRDIVNQGWNHVHLLGHSAGAAFIQGAADMIKALNQSIVVHETFLDPYLQLGCPGRSAYGANADWADSYFAHDFWTDDLGSLIIQPSLTEGRLANAYNVDATQLDPSALLVPAYCGSLADPSQICGFEVISRHDWPPVFYTNTVSGSQPGAEGLGFPLSKEGGGWANHGTYSRGDPPRILGTLVRLVHNEASAVVNPALQLGQLASQVSPSGIVQFLQKGFHARTGLGGGLPAWVSFAVPVTNQVNFVTFDAQFDSTNGAVGLLSAYWGTNLIGTVDERVVVPGRQQYSFALPEGAPTGLYLLGFRLDPHSDVQSSVNLTNIATGFSGVATQIQLHITRNATNSNHAITLTAAPGLYYQLQSSADLKNWTPLASVLNTNGTATMIEPATNSLGQRFYRAVVP
jgi:hypothetical protein